MEGLQSIFKTIVLFVLIDLSCQQAISKRATEQNADDKLFYYQQSEYPRDCQDIKTQCDDSESIKSRVYYIKPEGLPNPIEVFCDHDDDNGGWTVIQRRNEGNIDFYRNGTDTKYYKEGFGFLHNEFWMGNENLAFLVNQRKYILKIELTDTSGDNYTATYDRFQISDEKSGFKLVNLGDFASVDGGISDEMTDFQRDGTFYDSDGPCSGSIGWWFNSVDCSGSNLNGAYDAEDATKMKWGSIDIAKTAMKVRPRARPT